MNLNLKKLVFCLILPVLSLQILLQGILIYVEMRKTIIGGIDDVLHTVSDTLGGFLHGEQHKELLRPRSITDLQLSPVPEELWALDRETGELLVVNTENGRAHPASTATDQAWISITPGPDMTLFALAKNGRHIWQLTPLGTAIIDTEMVGQLERPQRRITGFNASERTLVVFGEAGLADYALDSQKLSEPVDRPILNSLEAWMPRAAAGWVGYDAETTTIVYLSRSFLPEETIALEGVKNQDIFSLLIPRGSDEVWAAGNKLLRIRLTDTARISDEFPEGFYSMQSRYYRDARNAMLLMKAELGLKYLYTQRLTDGKQIEYGIDATPEDHPDFCPPGTMDVIDPADYDALTKSVYHGGTYISDFQFWERWGYLKSAYAPIFSDTGEVIAMTGVDLSAQAVDVETRKATYAAFILGAIFILFSGSVSAWIALRLTSPIDSMKHSALLIAASQYQRRMPEQGITELKHLMERFNRLAGVIESKVVEMQRYYHSISRHTSLLTAARRLRDWLQPAKIGQVYKIDFASGSVNRHATLNWAGNGQELFIWALPNNGRTASDMIASLKLRAASIELIGKAPSQLASIYAVIAQSYPGAALFHARIAESGWDFHVFSQSNDRDALNVYAGDQLLPPTGLLLGGDTISIAIDSETQAMLTLPHLIEEVTT